MTREEFNTLFKKIEYEFDNFKGDYEEWYERLCEYPYKGVMQNLDNYKSIKPPLYSHLIKNLDKEVKKEPKYIQCDICKEAILVGDNWYVFEKHHRRCQKINFIDLMCMRTKHHHIPIVTYYEMSDEELDERYRKVMDYYVSQPRGEILKKL